jgi:hypothetical protein
MSQKSLSAELKLPALQAFTKDSGIPPDEIPKKAQNIFETFLHDLREKGQEFSETGIIYNASDLVFLLSYLHLIKTYGSNCFIYNKTDANPSNLGNIGIYLDIENQKFETNSPEVLEHFANSFIKCIKNDVKIIIIPLTIFFPGIDAGHANMLVYRTELNQLEHFEPNGELYEDYSQIVRRYLMPFIDAINKTRQREDSSMPNIVYIKPSHHCPESKRGFQQIESMLESIDIEGGGFCIMWSILFAELVLKNPTMPTNEILERINQLIRDQDGSRYLRDVIRGYIYIISNHLKKYLDVILSKDSFIKHLKARSIAELIQMLKNPKGMDIFSTTIIYKGLNKMAMEEFKKYNRLKPKKTTAKKMSKSASPKTRKQVVKMDELEFPSAAAKMDEPEIQAAAAKMDEPEIQAAAAKMDESVTKRRQGRPRKQSTK